MRTFWIGLFLLLPYGANAAVSISEVAWMGSIDSANHEWIELHNDGAATDVSGWLLSDGMNLEIELVGTIPANSYSVLERTSDDSAPGAAFIIYTGALVNSGATLQLLRGDGSLVDQVPGGENWINIGGDNVTKETAQYTSSGWKTAAPTPGSGLVWSGPQEQESNKSEVDETPKTSPSTAVKKTLNSSEPVRLVVPGVTLALKVDAQTIGYVHQPISFSVKPSGIGDVLIDSLLYQWNFGDGLVTTEKEPQHVFQYPGTYVVTVYGGYKRQEQVARHEITILPVKVSLTMNSDGDVQINNDSPYELDISGYKLQGEKVFIFPAYSILLPKQTVTIPKKKLGQTNTNTIVFYDTEIALVSSLSPYSLTSTNLYTAESEVLKPKITSRSLSQNAAVAAAESNAFSFVSTPIEDEGSESEPGFITINSAATSSQLASVGTAIPESSSRFTYLALAGVLGLAILGVYAAPRRSNITDSLE